MELAPREAKPVERREKVSQAVGAKLLALRCQRQDRVKPGRDDFKMG